MLGDRTQAPSGVGFALQNRVATARCFADHYAQANVHRLAGFFRSFRDQLNGMRNQLTNRVSILSPGPLNETYFEHAYIARYLGFGLLEGEDLTFEDGELMVRTVAGRSRSTCCGGGSMRISPTRWSSIRNRSSARRGWWRRSGAGA